MLAAPCPFVPHALLLPGVQEGGRGQSRGGGGWQAAPAGPDPADRTGEAPEAAPAWLQV